MESNPPVNSKAFWDTKFQEQWEQNNGPRYTRSYADVFLRLLPDWIRAAFAKGGSICDWGCAQGDAVDLIQDRMPTASVTGVDFSDEAIRKANNRFPKRAFLCEDWTSGASVGAAYDMVFSSHTLEHFPNSREVLWSVIAPHARKFIALLLPYDEDPRKRDPEHFDSFTRSSFEILHGDWLCVHFEVIFPERGGGMYSGRQCLVVYADSDAADIPAGLSIANVAGADEFRDALDSLAAENALLKERCATAEAKRLYQMECDKQILASSQRLNDALQASKDALAREKATRDGAISENAALRKSAADLTARLQTATDAKADLAARLDALQKRFDASQSDYESRLLAAVEAKAATATDVAVLAEKNNSLQSRLDAATAERDVLQARLDSATTERDALQSSSDAVIAERDSLQSRLDSATAEQDTLKARIAEVQSALDSEKAWTKQHTAEAEALRKQLDAARADTDRQKKALDTAKAEAAKVAETLAAAQAQGKSATAEATALKASLQTAQQSAQTLQQTLSETQKALQREKESAAAKAREFAAEKMRFAGEKAEWESIKRCRAYRVAQFYWNIRNPLAAKLHRLFHPTPKASPIPAVSSPKTVQTSSAPLPKAPPAPKKLRIASILDTFSESCFGNECDLLAIRPDNWRDILAAEKPDMLLVESAWNGNGGAWQYLVGTYGGSTRDKLRELIAECRKCGIPTAFWNKEDPPHFDKFIEAASLFDQVFTTDENCIPLYRKQCGHDRVAALPFAASPVIHNPFSTGPRDRDVCFAGTYYANRFEDRRQQMDVLLECGRDFAFDIYDRMHGNKSPGYENYLFPERFREFIRGRLDYADMLKTYRRYKVFLNTNSVVDSGTMFSRRVFELLACGTPVVTTPSLGIRRFFGDLVGEISDVEKGRKLVRRLLTDSDYYSRIQAAGVREVLSKHTYAIRLQTIAEALGLPWRRPVVRMAVFAVPDRRGAAGLLDMLGRQTLRPDLVVLPRKHESLCAKLREAGYNVRTGESAADPLLSEAGITAIAWMNAAHHYGPAYLLDASLSTLYAEGSLSGMNAGWHRKSGNLVLEGNADAAYTRSGGLLAETLVASRDHWASIAAPLRDAFTSGLSGPLSIEGFVRPPFEFSLDASSALSSKDLARFCL